MKVEGETSFAAPREVVWDVLNDPSKMAQTMPNVESFEVEDDRHWKANVAVPLGLGSLKMSIAFDKTEERPPEYAKLAAKGKGVGALLSMETQFELAEADGGTSMKWAADVSIAGPVGAMGQRVIQPIVNSQVKQVLAALDKQVQQAAAAGGGAEEGISPLAPEAYSDGPEGPTASTG
jgi:carbon monoxide dehydrogenase subunit G